MIPQYVAASLVSETKVLCHPASVDSIRRRGTGGSRVDGERGRLKAWQVLANCERAVAIELLVGQASSSSLRSSRAPAYARRERRARALAAPA